jgi:hypothetical protein
MIFGIGFRLLLVALAVAAERIGSFVRSNPWLRTLLASAAPKLPDDEV